MLAWQALAAAREQRATAEKVLRDYAMLAADEFARRSANEVGFNGFYPLVTALRQSPGPLLAPGDLSRSADETVRRATDLVLDTFRRDPGTGVLEVLGPEPSGPVHAWLSEHLATGPASPSGRRYETLHGDVAGALHSFVFAPSAVGTPGAVVGFEVALPALALRFQRARDRGPLFPQSVARGVVGNEALFLRVLDPFGREIFRAGSIRQPYLGVQRPFAADYNAILEGFVVDSAVDPAAAGALVIVGLPRARLPSLIGLFAITVGLVLTALLQLNRERALARLRSDFVSRVSHELRTPLTQIRMLAETLLLDRVRTEEERARSRDPPSGTAGPTRGPRSRTTVSAVVSACRRSATSRSPRRTCTTAASRRSRRSSTTTRREGCRTRIAAPSSGASPPPRGTSTTSWSSSGA